MAPSLGVPLWTERLRHPNLHTRGGGRHGARTPLKCTHTYFSHFTGADEVETQDFPALNRAWPHWPGPAPPRSAPPPQVDGSSSWDSSGARRQLRASDSGRNARPSARPRTCRRRLPRPPVYPGPLRRGVAERAPPPGLGPGTLRPRSQRSGRGLWRGQRSAPPPFPAAKFGPAGRTWCLYLAGQRLARRHLVSQELTARAGG